MFVAELNRDLHGRLLEIWEGRSGLPAETEEAYRQLWRATAGSGPQDETHRRTALCVYLGPLVARADCLCPMQHTYACGLGRGTDGRCVPNGECQTCNDYVADE